MSEAAAIPVPAPAAVGRIRPVWRRPLAIAGAAYAWWRSEEAKEAAALSETLDKVITDLGEGREEGCRWHGAQCRPSYR